MFYYCTVTADELQFTARAQNDRSLHDALALYDTLQFKYGTRNVNLWCAPKDAATVQLFVGD